MKHSPICFVWNKNWNINRRTNVKYALLFAGLFLLVASFFVLNISVGSVEIPFSEVFKILFGQNGRETFRNIVWQIRLPRAVAAIVLGGALALSGYLLQTFFHNPIAGPFVLGISSGAKLAVALVMVSFSSAGSMSGISGMDLKMNSFILVLAAFVGAMLSMGFVLLFSQKLQQTSALVVTGIMIGYICSAVTDLVVTFAQDSDIVNLHNWSMGSFSGISWDNVVIMTVVVFIAVSLVFLMSKPVSAYQLGEAYARNMGVNIELFRIALVILSSILSACVTAFAGPVSFVGIAVPQILKMLFRTAKPILMIPACFLGGALWCLFCDLLARTLFAPTELSISTVTAIFGVPVVIYVMIRQKRDNPV